MGKSFLKVFAIIITIVILVTGCGKTTTQPSQTQTTGTTAAGTTATTTAAEIKGGTLKYGLSSEPASLEPVKASGTVQRVLKEAIYRGLFGFDSTGKMTNELAASCEVSADNLKYTIKIIDAKFHNGDAVTAQDVVYTFERILNADTGASFRQELSVISSVVASDNKTIVFTLKEACEPFLQYLALPESAIVSKSYTESKGGKLDTTPMGAGPFKFVSWTKGQKLIVEKFADYYKENKPNLDKIEFSFYADEDARTNALKSGEIGMLDYVAWKDIPALKSDSNLTLDEQKGPVMILSFNMNTKPLNDPKVRQAISFAINRENIINMAFNGQGIQCTGFVIREGDVGYNKDLANFFSYNVEKAKQLLAEAGYPNGFSCRLLASSSYSMHQQTAIAVQSDLKAIGIEVTLDLPDWATRMSKVGEKDYDIFVNAMSGDYNDPDWLSNYMQSGTHTFNKSAGFINADVDRLLNEGRKTYDAAKRDSIYQELSEVLLEQSPHVFLNWRSQTTGMSVKVKGYAARPGNLVLTQAGLALEDIYLEK